MFVDKDGLEDVMKRAGVSRRIMEKLRRANTDSDTNRFTGADHPLPECPA